MSAEFYYKYKGWMIFTFDKKVETKNFPPLYLIGAGLQNRPAPSSMVSKCISLDTSPANVWKLLGMLD